MCDLNRFGRSGIVNSPMKLKPLGLAISLVCPPAMAADSNAFASARTQFESGRFEAARHSIEKLEADEPEKAEVHYYLGQLALERDDAEAALIIQ